MRKIIIISIILLIFTFRFAFSQSEVKDRNVKIKVPTEWINKLRNFDYKQNNYLLLKEFESFIKPVSLLGSKDFAHEKGGILNPMFVNLDDDSNEELIGLFGWNEINPALVVFNLIGEDWYLQYFEPFDMFYSAPELQVANNFSVNKTFYIRWLYQRGSGVYRDAYHFYKLIDNKVYPCLVLINKASIFGWGLYLNQIVSSNFKFNSANEDALWVTYNYDFFPGAVYEDDAPWDGHEDNPFVSGENSLSYIWDSITFTYKPQPYELEGYLTLEKIACFSDFGNDTLFVKAFDYEIKQTLENGTAEQKKLLQRYLDILKVEINAEAPTGGIEEKAQTGTIKFYGTEKKK